MWYDPLSRIQQLIAPPIVCPIVATTIATMPTDCLTHHGSTTSGLDNVSRLLHELAPPTVARTIRVNATGSCAMSAYHVVPKPRVASALPVGLLPGFVIPTTARPINVNATGLCTTSSIDRVYMHWPAFAAVERSSYATACKKVVCSELSLATTAAQCAYPSRHMCERCCVTAYLHLKWLCTKFKMPSSNQGLL